MSLTKPDKEEFVATEFEQRILVEIDQLRFIKDPLKQNIGLLTAIHQMLAELRWQEDNDGGKHKKHYDEIRKELDSKDIHVNFKPTQVDEENGYLLEDKSTMVQLPTTSANLESGNKTFMNLVYIKNNHILWGIFTDLLYYLKTYGLFDYRNQISLTPYLKYIITKGEEEENLENENENEHRRAGEYYGD